VGHLAGVRTALLGVLVSGCGKTTDETNRLVRGDSSDSPSDSTPRSGHGASGDLDLARADEDREPVAPCASVDGQLSYGPIGEPWTLPLTRADDIFGVRTGEGHAFAWRTYYDPRGPSPNLFSAKVDVDFLGWEARALAAGTAASTLELVPVPGGFIAAICREESQLEWIALSDDFAESSSPRPAPEAPCDYALPGVLWTGEVYLVSFTDARGFVVVCLDEQGAVLGEEVLDPRVSQPIRSRFSKNGDRVLLVFEEGQVGGTLYTVFDGRGTRLTELQAFGTEYSSVNDIAIAPSDDGWLVATDSWGDAHGVVLRVVSGDGMLTREEWLFGRYVVLLDLAPSAYGGGVLIAQWDNGGQFGGTEAQIALIDAAGEVVFSDERPGGFPVGFALDPARDLVIKGSEDQLTVQEYGCLE
jgi:hypothetical protein